MFFITKEDIIVLNLIKYKYKAKLKEPKKLYKCTIIVGDFKKEKQ